MARLDLQLGFLRSGGLPLWGFRLGPDSKPEDLLAALSGTLDPDPEIKTWIPADPCQIFEIFKGRDKELLELLESMPDLPERVQTGTRTKLALWHDMLRASGLFPLGRTGDTSQFALHSFLIVVARMVTHLLSSRGSNWKSCLKDGFASWVLGWPRGEWVESVRDTVRRYDWRSRRGGVPCTNPSSARKTGTCWASTTRPTGWPE